MRTVSPSANSKPKSPIGNYQIPSQAFAGGVSQSTIQSSRGLKPVPKQQVVFQTKKLVAKPLNKQGAPMSSSQTRSSPRYAQNPVPPPNKAPQSNNFFKQPMGQQQAFAPHQTLEYER